MQNNVVIGEKAIGTGCPVFVIAEIGINHNGDLQLAKQLIDIAVDAGCDAVKFQKRTPEICVPTEQRDVMRETPWGLITYMDYRHKVELGISDYTEIDQYCRSKGIVWFASCWDKPSVDFIAQFKPACYKVASASLTDDELLLHINSKGKPVILSTGMSTMEEIRHSVDLLSPDQLLIAHSTSSYPCKTKELNLRMINTFQGEFNFPIGYSGHEVGLQTTLAAVALGATFIERHITIDRSMWGSDQSASVELQGLIRLVRDIRIIEEAIGDGVKRLYEGEIVARQKLRRR